MIPSVQPFEHSSFPSEAIWIKETTYLSFCPPQTHTHSLGHNRTQDGSALIRIKNLELVLCSLCLCLLNYCFFPLHYTFSSLKGSHVWSWRNTACSYLKRFEVPKAFSFCTVSVTFRPGWWCLANMILLKTLWVSHESYCSSFQKTKSTPWHKLFSALGFGWDCRGTAS